MQFDERNDDHSGTYLTDRDPAILSIVVTLIGCRDQWTRKDMSRICEVDAMLRQVREAFSLVPFEVDAVCMYVHNVRTIFKTPLDSNVGVVARHLHSCRIRPDSCQ